MKYPRTCSTCNQSFLKAKWSAAAHCDACYAKQWIANHRHSVTCSDCNKTRQARHTVVDGTRCGPCSSRRNTNCLPGELNQMYGKQHTVEAKARMSAHVKTTAQIESAKRVFVQNKNSRHYYDTWVEKYGTEEADRRMAEVLHKASLRMQGEGNHMYGKPSPKGSGAGWQGYFNGHYFRSIYELSYLKLLHDTETQFENAERKQHGIQYVTDAGVARNYFCDFYLPTTGEYIEIKPKELVHTMQNKVKFEAARQKHGEKFSVKTQDDFHLLTTDEIAALYKDGSIKWTAKYDQRFKERFK